uniref:Small ribosomal subunit protein uS17 n=1 Tax=Suricata suricatta TaxID=37032 RepID=A0A673UGI7_SURSU
GNPDAAAAFLFPGGREDGGHSDRACLPKAANHLSKQEEGSAWRNWQGEAPAILQKHRSGLQDAQGGRGLERSRKEGDPSAPPPTCVHTEWLFQGLVGIVVHVPEATPPVWFRDCLCRAHSRLSLVQAIEGTYIDKKCPFTGNVSIRGRILSGVVTKMKMQRTIVIRRDYLHYIRKYNRFEKRHKNMSVHLSPCFR